MHAPVRLHAHQRRRRRVAHVHQVEPEVADVGPAFPVDDQVVQVPAAVLGQVGVDGHRSVHRAPHQRVVAHRDDRASTRPAASPARTAARAPRPPLPPPRCPGRSPAPCACRSPTRTSGLRASVALRRTIRPRPACAAFELPWGRTLSWNACCSASSISPRSRKGPPGPRRCRTRSTWRASPISSAITATGWPSTTAGRCSPDPRPEALIGPIAAATERIRVGSGGVMLPHYSPFKVAETFSVLAGLYPGRIDLGLGRAAGTDPMTTHALQRDRSARAPGRLPGAAERAARLLRGHDQALEPARAAAEGAPRPPGDARAVAARLLAAERRLGRRPGSPLRVRGLHQPQGADIAQMYAARVQGRRPARRAPDGRRRVGARRRQRGGGDPARGLQPDGVRDAAPRAPDRGPAAGDRRALPRTRWTKPTPARPTGAAPSWARRSRCARASRPWPPSTARRR